jgi:hypothetical protein
VRCPAVALLVVAAPFVACGGRTDLALPSAGGSLGDAGAPIPDASLPVDAAFEAGPEDAALAPDANAAPDAAVTNSGTVAFYGTTGLGSAHAPSATTWFQAQFFDGEPSEPDAGCTIVDAGDCYGYSGCNPPNPPGVSAGTLSLQGGELGAGVSLPPDPNSFFNYTYSNSNGAPPAFFQDGDSLTVEATGADVPPFGVTLVAPGPGTLVSPVPGPNAYYAVPATSDLRVRWSGGEAGARFVFNMGLGPGWAGFSCSWDATAGQGTVPQSLITLASGGGFTGFSWGQRRATTLIAGTFAIEASVEYDGFVGDLFVQ